MATNSIDISNHNPIYTWVLECLALTKRNLLRAYRTPEMIIFGLAQPLMFVLLFSQVYGAAIQIDGTNYTSFMMAGIFCQSTLLGASFSGTNFGQQLKEGIIDRFRALPISRSSIIFGTISSSSLIDFISLLLMMIAGFIAGWRFDAPLSHILLGTLLLILFAEAFAWISIALSNVISPEALIGATQIVLFPITFISNAFVPAESLPTYLQPIAYYNPFSVLVEAVRTLYGNKGNLPTPDLWVHQHSVLSTIIIIALLHLIFIPTTVYLFNRQK